MNTSKKIEFYVCTGGNGIYYTLRKVSKKSASNIEDVFVKNLSVAKDRALLSAQNYVNTFKSKVGDLFDVELDLTPRQAITNLWGDGKIPTERLNMLRLINTGVIPYGMHRGKTFEDIPSDYLAWACTESLKKNDPVTNNVASAAFCVLLERGEVKQLADVEKLLIPKINTNLKSTHFGLLKDRQALEAVIEYHKKDRSIQFNRDSHFYKLRIGDDVLIYSGSVYLGEVDQSVKMKATIDQHVIYHDIKSTVIKRPHLI